jgi:serine/threonine protein kinase/Flp pilus assembly protein TadD
MSLSAGSRLGPYDILSPLGAGGFGEVYKARDTRLDRTVAIKILPSADPELKARFEREAKAIAALTHPHICTLYDVGHQDGTDYLVMEYLEGETLAARISRGPIKIDEALKISIQIAEALDKAHRAGIVHRDLKPANVMLTKSGAKLLDFGIAKLMSVAPAVNGMNTATVTTPTVTAVILGTLQYMAPEQLEGRAADGRADIFAFGAVLYEMLTGQKAFHGARHAAVIGTTMTASVPPLSVIRPESPQDLDQCLHACFAVDPNERWQTACDLLRELRRLAQGNDTVANGGPSADRQRPSIAVMPFANLSGEAEQDYFVDGIVEDVIVGLSRIKWLMVISRMSTFAYKDKSVDARQVGRDLGVRYMLEGTIRKAESRIRITTQLIDTTTNAPLWAERYDRTMTGLFELQDEITMTVVGVIEPALREAELQRVRRKRPNSIDAYDLYLRGINCLRVYMPNAADHALEFFRQALSLHPEYPAAQAAAAWCYEVRYMRGGLHAEDQAAALAHARAAIETGADDAMTLATAGFVIGLVAHDYETAMEIIDRSLALTHASSFALALGSVVLAHAGRTDAAIAYANRALQITPSGPDAVNPNIGLAIAYCASGTFDQAASAASQAARANPGFSLAHVLHAAALSAIGRMEEGRVAMRRVLELEPNFTVDGFVRAHSGRPDIWLPIGRLLEGVAS